MMKRADHGGGIKQTGHKRQLVHICGHIDVTFRCTQARSGLFQLGVRIVEQHNALKAVIARRIAPGPGAKFQQQFSA